ncbi:MAG: polyphosphate kinase 2 [Cyanobacteria bacterium PR.023]|jgi:polyphosphate kinase 2|nr:polyphosphate kinase 2 [Cyanobacteria bacterium PR.023]MDQ5935735.1 polyphosphate kinase [Cyanobacteriota bacterium erpe_2018_sw_21hr_WHONDRS-SW48-000092_B_bin.40]
MSTDKKASGVSSSPIDVDSIALIDSDQAKSASNSITVPGNNKNGHGTAAPEPEAKKKKTQIEKSESKLSEDDLRRVNTNKGLLTLLRTKDIKIKDVTADLEYEEELERLQVELVKLQRWVQDKGKRVAIILEGRDAAGKGGTIRRFTEHLNPRSMRVVALPKPTQQERGQWYFQRYSVQLPNAGEIVFFDRSWYNRAVVEPVNGFCTKVEYQRFIQQVPEFEHMLYEDGITIIKFWFSISKEEQRKRFESRQSNPLKQWKLSPIDQQAQDLWEHYTSHKEEMFSRTHMSFSPWIVVKANDKRMARLESIRYVLNLLDYTGKGDAKVRLYPDPNIVNRFHRQIANID